MILKNANSKFYLTSNIMGKKKKKATNIYLLLNVSFSWPI